MQCGPWLNFARNFRTAQNFAAQYFFLYAFYTHIYISIRIYTYNILYTISVFFEVFMHLPHAPRSIKVYFCRTIFEKISFFFALLFVRMYLFIFLYMYLFI